MFSTIAIGSEVTGVAAHDEDGSAWVLMERGTVVRVDPADQSVTEMARIPGLSVAIAAGDGAVWVLWVDEMAAGFVSRVSN